MIIDCDTCRVRGPACQDCMVTAIIGHPPETAVEIDVPQQQALSVLAATGLVPPLRLVPLIQPGRPARGSRAAAG